MVYIMITFYRFIKYKIIHSWYPPKKKLCGVILDSLFQVNTSQVSSVRVWDSRKGFVRPDLKYVLLIKVRTSSINLSIFKVPLIIGFDLFSEEKCHKFRESSRKLMLKSWMSNVIVWHQIFKKVFRELLCKDFINSLTDFIIFSLELRVLV